MARAQAPRAAALTLSEAAKATGKHRDVIRRLLDGGKLPNAYRDDDAPARPWMVPPGDLEANGLRLHAPGSSAAHGEPQGAPTAADEAVELRRQRDQARADAERWQAIAEERARALDLATVALRALPPAGGTPPPRRWFGRRQPAS